MLNIFFPELHPLYTFIALFIKKKTKTKNTKNIDDFSLRIQKKNYSKIKVYCKQNRDFFEEFQICLTSSLYRSMWTIGQSQRVEEKKNIDLSSVKYYQEILVLLS